MGGKGGKGFGSGHYFGDPLKEGRKITNFASATRPKAGMGSIGTKKSAAVQQIAWLLKGLANITFAGTR